MPDNKCKWKSKSIPDFKCLEAPLPDDTNSYCILHSKNEDKDLGEFTAKVNDRLKGTKTDEGKEEIDLIGCYFPKEFPSNFFRNLTFDKPVYFSEATFSQEAYFSEAKFSQAYFRGATFSQAYFSEATFSQEADFSRAKFSQADFDGAKFSQADFIGATFSQVAYFSGATFSQADFSVATFSQANFIEATFSQMAFFNWATFSQKAYFSEATFSQEANFIGATFSQADFTGIAFEEGVAFLVAEFKDRASFLPSLERKVKFGGPSLFHYTRFTGEVIFQDVDLSKCSFLHSNIDKVDFRYCTFAKKGYRQNVLRDELDCDVAKKRVDRKEYEPVRRLYLELKRNFENKKDWNTAGEFHFGEMECRRKMKGWLGRNIFSLEALYFGLSGYGERPLRAFRILLEFVLILFPLLYILSEGKIITEYFTSLLDSLKVATLMRLGNPIEPNTGFWKSIVAVAELIVVPLQTALLALALRRKVRR